MHLSKEVVYPLDAAALSELFADPQFHTRLSEKMQAVDENIQITPAADGGLKVVARRTTPAEDVPKAARKLIGSTMESIQSETWSAPDADGARTGELLIEVPKAKLTYKAKITRRPGTDSTTDVFDGELKASVPVIGGLLEKQAKDSILDGLQRRAEVCRELRG